MIDLNLKIMQNKEAWNLLDKMSHYNLQADNQTLAVLFKTLSNSKYQKFFPKAVSEFKRAIQLKNPLPDVILFNILLDQYIICKKLEMAISLVRELKDQDVEDLKPDTVSFNTIIKGCAQEKQFEIADEMFKLMKTFNLEPNDVTFNSMIDVCVRCDKNKEAWELFEEMQRLAISPDNFTFSTLIKGIKPDNYQQSGIRNFKDLDRGFELLEKMNFYKTSKPDEILYNCLIDACVRFNEVGRAIKIFNEMKQKGIKPSSVTYGILIKAYGQTNQLDNAFYVFNDMRQQNLTPNNVTYGCLIDACIKNNRVDHAMDVFNTIQQEGVHLNVIIYTTLIKGFSKSLELDQALKVFEIMRKDSEIQPNNITFNSLIDCCVRCTDIPQAEAIFDDMKQSGVSPDLITYSTMIKGYCKIGKIENALVTLNEMDSSGRIKPDEVLYNSLLDGCCKANELDLAHKVYLNMIALGISPSNVTYSILVKIYGKERNLNKALGVLDQMKENGVKPGLIVYTCLLQTCMKAKQIKIALQIFNDMKYSGVQGD